MNDKWSLIINKDNRRFFIRRISPNDRNNFYITEEDSNVMSKVTITELKNDRCRNTNLFAYNWEAEEFEELVKKLEEK